MKQLLVLSALLLISLLELSAQRSVSWRGLEIDQAIDLAKRQGKMVFVDTYTRTCAPCKAMDREFKNPALAQYMNQHFVSLKVDMNSTYGQSIKTPYELVFLPTLMVIDTDGNMRYKVDKLVKADELLTRFKMIVENNISISEASTVQATPHPPKHRRANPSPPPTPRSAQPTTSRPAPSVTAQPGEKILKILDRNNPASFPPEVLRQEAYHKMSLANGSHHKAALDYLNTQSDWSSDVNIRFVFDFLHQARGPLFDFVVQHLPDFYRVIGREQFDLALHAIVNQQLTRGFPRPTLEESITLYQFIEPDQAELLAHRYQLQIIGQEQGSSQYLDAADTYLAGIGQNDHATMHEVVAAYLATTPLDASRLPYYIDLQQRAIQSSVNDAQYYLQLAHLYYHAEDKKAANHTLREARQVAENQGQKLQIPKLLSQKIETM